MIASTNLVAQQVITDHLQKSLSQQYSKNPQRFLDAFCGLAQTDAGLAQLLDHHLHDRLVGDSLEIDVNLVRNCW